MQIYTNLLETRSQDVSRCCARRPSGPYLKDRRILLLTEGSIQRNLDPLTVIIQPVRDFSFSEILQHVKTEVAAKRQAGLYPPGLERELELEFAAIVDRSTTSGGWRPDEVRNLVMDYLAVIDHLAMTIVELEARVSRLETGGRG